MIQWKSVFVWNKHLKCGARWIGALQFGFESPTAPSIIKEKLLCFTSTKYNIMQLPLVIPSTQNLWYYIGMVDEPNQEIRKTFATGFEVCTLDWRLRHMVKEERIFGQLHSHEKLNTSHMIWITWIQPCTKWKALLYGSTRME